MEPPLVKSSSHNEYYQNILPNEDEDNEKEGYKQEESYWSEPHSSDSIIDSGSSSKKGNRWGNDEDIELFKLIHSDEIKGILSLNEILDIEADYEIEDNPILEKLKEKTGWKFSLKSLLVRIKGKMRNTFSKREEKSLKRLVKKQRYDPKYGEVFLQYPGKSQEAIKVVCDAICREKSKKMLSHLDVNDELRRMRLI